MTVDVNQELGALVIENPTFVPILEKFKLDFCCQGKRSLVVACQEKGIDVDEVLAELSKATAAKASKNWLETSLTEIVDHIQERYHTPLHTELPSIVEKAHRVARVHGQYRPELAGVADLVTELAESLLEHTQKEDKTLFPWIKSLEKGEAKSEAVADPISALEDDHKEAGAILDKIREATNDYDLPMSACTTYRLLYAGLEQLEKDTHVHIHLENSVLFPRTLELAKQ